MVKVSNNPFYYSIITTIIFLSLSSNTSAQQANGLWHGKQRTIHYKPSGNDFILHQGTKKFNRALYGSNTSFRVETGDLPEFALYLQGMGGNCRIAIAANGRSKWITDAANIKTVYRPGSMHYEIKDDLLKNGTIFLTVRATYDREAMILQMRGENIPANTGMDVVYGGVTGKRFSRDGDIGADPESSFYLKPEYCRDNHITIQKNHFSLAYGANDNMISGVFPTDSKLRVVDASAMGEAPQKFVTRNTETPALLARFGFSGHTQKYFLIQKEKTDAVYAGLNTLFSNAATAATAISNRVMLETPDEYINPMGAALAMAADAIWEDPTFMHGAIAWRMRLPAWRGAFAADPLGWHERARIHFDSYLKSQVTDIAPGPVVADTALHIARQQEKMGNAMFSNGYICRNPNGDIRPHHYDMNSGFFDQVLNHFKYTGDIDYVRKIWPALKLHLEWEKRNFDMDGDGLYDAYACIWASDALQYSGGGVTHSTAYNYRANSMAAELAKLLGENGSKYQSEANKILAAMNHKLWLQKEGTFAEYIDLQGLQRTHNAPGLWTIYHAIDGGTATPQQRYQMLRYVDKNIPHIPVKANGLPDEKYYLLSTTNWQPYTWSVNNVALAENLHTALAYWLSDENENAFRLWKSALVESMYLASSPGSFQQLSFYDAVRGELYRDFADPVGLAARTLTEGLFGILPDALNGRLVIKPGFPSDWKFAKISVPDVSVDFKRTGNTSSYKISQRYKKTLNLSLEIPVRKEKVGAVTINGKPANYKWIENSFDKPMIQINAGTLPTAVISISSSGSEFAGPNSYTELITGTDSELKFNGASIVSVEDPQDAFHLNHLPSSLNLSAKAKPGCYTLFVKLKQGDAGWIQPLNILIKPRAAIIASSNESEDALEFYVENYSGKKLNGTVILGDFRKQIEVTAKGNTSVLIPSAFAQKGTNPVLINWEDGTQTEENIINWNLSSKKENIYETVAFNNYFNEQVTNIFKNKYMNPRPASVTLQIPWQGIGNWCYPLIQPEISDTGTTRRNELRMGNIPFRTAPLGNNISFTSLWDNFPDSLNIPLAGKASHAYLLMAGTTNHQQSNIENGVVTVRYSDGSADRLQLINPQNWWPIEQDLMNDGYAFNTGAPKPYRLILKTGEITRTFSDYSVIKGFSNMGIDGGAGTVLDIPLDSNKTLQSLTLKTTANEVIIGLMALTLLR